MEDTPVDVSVAYVTGGYTLDGQDDVAALRQSARRLK